MNTATDSSAFGAPKRPGAAGAIRAYRPDRTPPNAYLTGTESEADTIVSETDSNASLAGSLDESTQIEEGSRRYGGQRSSSTIMGDSTIDTPRLNSGDEIDNDYADQVIGKATKIRGLRLRYMFIISFMFAFTAFAVVFLLIERAYTNSLRNTGELACSRTGAYTIDKLINSLFQIQNLYISAATTFYTLQDIQLGGAREWVVRKVNSSLANILCDTSLGITAFTMWEYNTTNGTCNVWDTVCPFAGHIGFQESELVDDEYVQNSEREPRLPGSNMSINLLPQPGVELGRCQQAATNGAFMYLSGISANELRWNIGDPYMGFRMGLNMVRSGVQSYMFSLFDSSSAMLSNGIRSESAMIASAPVSSHDPRRETVLFTSNGEPQPSRSEVERTLHVWRNICLNGTRHTWHFPYHVGTPVYNRDGFSYVQNTVDDVASTESQSRNNVYIEDIRGQPTVFSLCAVACPVPEGTPNGTWCNTTSLTETEYNVFVISTDISEMAQGQLFQLLNAAGFVCFLLLLFVNVYFHFSIAVPTYYLHKRIVSTMTGKPWKRTRWQRAMITISRPLWVGDLKAILGSFTVMSVFYMETRKYMPEYLRKQQLERLHNAESLIDMIHEEQAKERAELVTSSATASAFTDTDSETPGNLRRGNSMLTEQVLMVHSDAFSQAMDAEDKGDGQEMTAVQVSGPNMNASVHGQSLHLANIDNDLNATQREQSMAMSMSFRAGAHPIGQSSQQIYEPQTPLGPAASFRFVKTAGAGTGTANLNMAESISVVCIHIGYMEQAFKYDFKGAERQHRQIVGCLLSIVRKYHGAVFTRRGESMGVCWNAFEAQSGHTLLAVRCARDIAKVFDAVRQQGFNIGIAVNTGPAICGSLGDEGFVMNVAFGDTIRLGFAIAELSKKLDCATLLITETVKQSISNKYECLIVDVIKLETEMGEVETLTLFDIRGDVKSKSPLEQKREERQLSKSKRLRKGASVKSMLAAEQSYLVQYNTAFAFFRNHDFSNASMCIESLHSQYGPNRLSERLRLLCKMATAKLDAIPKPYHRPFPDWLMFEKDMENYAECATSAFLEEGVNNDSANFSSKAGTTDFSVLRLQVPSAAQVEDEPVFAAGKRQGDMSTFRQDLETAVTKSKQNSASSPDGAGKRENARTPSSAGKGTPKPAPPPPPQDLEDSLIDLRATDYVDHTANNNSIVAENNGSMVDKKPTVNGGRTPHGKDEEANTTSFDAKVAAGNGDQFAASLTKDAFQGTLNGSLQADIAIVNPDSELPGEIQTGKGVTYTRSTSILGKGSYGCVYLGMEQHTGKFIAMKFLPLPVGEVEREKIVNEVHIMQTVRDSHIVDFYDFAIVGGRIVLIMECVVPGSLSSMLHNFHHLSPVTTANFMKDILKGLHKLHSKGIVHRDVKPQNVLITSNGLCKLSDFGASAALGEFVRREGVGVGVVVGTPLYMAPEAARGDPNALSDIWSVGIMFLELINGHVPYEMTSDLRNNPALFVYRIGSGDLKPTYSEEELSEVTLDFVRRCLAEDSSKRSTAEELLSLPFFSV